MKIELLEEVSEFCSSRTDVHIPHLRQKVSKALQSGVLVLVSRQGVKSITVSFLDEWLGPLIVQFGLERVQAGVQFEPPLEPFLAQQLERSHRLRG
ncbi:hypothetical protein WDW37_09965 [Bdellovibrionota bacterium FG-1]